MNEKQNSGVSVNVMDTIQSSVSLFTIFLLFGGTCGDELDNECSPAIAESCFKGFWNDTLYGGKSRDDVCSSVYDKILCTQDIIDDGCKKGEGRDNFDTWISGISGVYVFLCQAHPALLKELLENVEPKGHCFDLASFITCVEKMTRVTHVTDMLYVTMDAVECYWLVSAFSVCGTRATPNQCQHVQGIITELLQVFFQESKCTYACNRACTSESSTLLLSASLLVLSLRKYIFS